MKFRILSFLIFVVPCIALLTALFFLGYTETWQVFGFPLGQNLFNDSRAITAGSESFHLGFDPLIENPAMPSGNVMNYPRIWHMLFYFNINQSHTVIFASICIALYIFSSALIYSKLKNSISKVMFMMLVFSPAALLGIERGNIDLIIIFIVVIGALLVKRASIFITLISLAYFLKLYPVFSFICILAKDNIKKHLNKIICVSAIISAYLLISYNDFVLIWNATPKSGELSYGKDVIISAINTSRLFKNSNLSGYSLLLSNFLKIAFFLISLFSIYIGIKETKFFRKNKTPLEINSLFMAGAAIYCGTFILGNNWDYRLIFLNLTFPFLYQSALMSENLKEKLTYQIGILAIFLSSWDMFLAKYFSGISALKIIFYLFDQLVNWLLFAILLFLICKFVSTSFKNPNLVKVAKH